MDGVHVAASVTPEVSAAITAALAGLQSDEDAFAEAVGPAVTDASDGDGGGGGGDGDAGIAGDRTPCSEVAVSSSFSAATRPISGAADAAALLETPSATPVVGAPMSTKQPLPPLVPVSLKTADSMESLESMMSVDSQGMPTEKRRRDDSTSLFTLMAPNVFEVQAITLLDPAPAAGTAAAAAAAAASAAAATTTAAVGAAPPASHAPGSAPATPSQLRFAAIMRNSVGSEPIVNVRLTIEPLEVQMIEGHPLQLWKLRVEREDDPTPVEYRVTTNQAVIVMMRAIRPNDDANQTNQRLRRKWLSQKLFRVSAQDARLLVARFPEMAFAKFRAGLVLIEWPSDPAVLDLLMADKQSRVKLMLPSAKRHRNMSKQQLLVELEQLQEHNEALAAEVRSLRAILEIYQHQQQQQQQEQEQEQPPPLQPPPPPPLAQLSQAAAASLQQSPAALFASPFAPSMQLVPQLQQTAAHAAGLMLGGAPLARLPPPSALRGLAPADPPDPLLALPNLRTLSAPMYWGGGRPPGDWGLGPAPPAPAPDSMPAPPARRAMMPPPPPPPPSVQGSFGAASSLAAAAAAAQTGTTAAAAAAAAAASATEKHREVSAVLAGFRSNVKRSA